MFTLGLKFSGDGACKWWVKGQVGKEADHFVDCDTWVFGKLELPICVTDLVLSNTSGM